MRWYPTLSAPNAYGYQRCLTYQVLDEDGTPLPGLTVGELVTPVYNNLRQHQDISGHPATTDVAGKFGDTQALLFFDLPPATACLIQKQSITVQHRKSAARVNCLKKNVSDVSVIDITSTPNSCGPTPLPGLPCN